MLLQVLQGYGKFEKDGKDIEYPIRKLIVTNEEKQSVEIKLDKTEYRILSYLFDFKDSGVTEDENGVQCSLFLLKGKSEVDVD